MLCDTVFENVALRVGAGVMVVVMLSLGDAEKEIEFVTDNVGVVVNSNERVVEAENVAERVAGGVTVSENDRL